MDDTNTLCEAVVAWVSAVLPRLGPDQFQIIEAMLAGRCDVAVEARLLKGTVTLVAIGEAHGPMVLYRDAVAPLRPGFVSLPKGAGASDGAMCKSMRWLGRAERTQVGRVQLPSTEPGPTCESYCRHHHHRQRRHDHDDCDESRLLEI